MIALDTNVLVRFLVVDTQTPEHTTQARAVVARAFQREEQVLLPIVAVIEATWVLATAVRTPKATVIALLDAFRTTPGVVVEEAGAVDRALRAWAEGPAGFSDYLARELALSAGARVLVSFDRKLRRAPGVVAPMDPTVA